jgi:nicotinate-nucleotide--dimethylbenzimidazole phosphoribosyltransferase
MPAAGGGGAGAGRQRVVGAEAVIDLEAMGRDVTAPGVMDPAPPGAGRLGELACWLAAAQGHWPPAEPARPLLVLVTGPDPATTGGPGTPTAAGATAAGAGAPAPDSSWAEGVTQVAAGTDLAVRVVAATGGVEAALAAGIAAADAAVDEGADLLVVAGAGSQVPAAAAVAALTSLEPADAVAAAGDDGQWRREVIGVRDLLRALRPQADTSYALLSGAGSPVLTTLAGLVLQASVRRTPIVLDGLAACAAGATLFRLAPFIESWWLVADRAASPAQHAALAMMRQQPVFDWAAPAGHAGPLVVPVLRAAARAASAPGGRSARLDR